MNMEEKRTENIIETCKNHMDDTFYIVEDGDYLWLSNKDAETGKISHAYDVTFMGDINLAYLMIVLDADTMTQTHMELLNY